jgi:hypothetical protein
MSRRYRAQAMFGPGTGDAFQSLREIPVAIQVSADLLIQMAGEGLDVQTPPNVEPDNPVDLSRR